MSVGNGIIYACDVGLYMHLTLVRRRSDHELRLDEAVKLLGGESLELHGGILQGETLLVSVLGDLAGHVVSNLGIEASNKHETGFVLVLRLND